MTSKLKIQELFPFKKELKELLNQLLHGVELQVIYLSELEINEHTFFIINGILERKITFSKEQLTLLHNLENSNSPFKLQLYTKKQLSAALHNGDLYVIQHCYYGKVVYQHDDSNLILSKFKDTFLYGYRRGDKHPFCIYKITNSLLNTIIILNATINSFKIITL
ncbi:hypothetical protein ACG2LH_05615 [Zhouia sp. PK063]|uniref:hypothetical protein n=1 Tax=Zhouia sp. PK063 TaxID=3373602 RepID=UPI0037AA90F0